MLAGVYLSATPWRPGQGGKVQNKSSAKRSANDLCCLSAVASAACLCRAVEPKGCVGIQLHLWRVADDVSCVQHVEYHSQQTS